MRDSERALKQMSVGDMLDYSIEIYKRNFKKLTKLTLVFYIPFIFIYSLVISYFSADVQNISSNPDRLANNLERLPFMMIAYYITLLGMFFLYLVYSLTIKAVFDAAVVKVVYSDVVHNKQQDLKSIIKDSFRKFKPLFVNRILFYLIMLGIVVGAYILIIVVFILGILGFSTYGFFNTMPKFFWGFVLIAGILVLSLLLVIPLSLVVSYFYAKFGMGVHSVVIENKSASEAVSRCNEISKKSFWSISLTFGIGMILFFTIPAILSAGAQSLVYFNKVLFIVASTAAQIIGALLNPFTTTLLTVIFINQKIKTEGLDLEVKVDKMILKGTRAVNNEDFGDNSNEN